MGVGQVVDRYAALPSSSEGKAKDAILVRDALALSAAQIANGDAASWSFQVGGRLLGVANKDTHPHLETLVAALRPEGRWGKKQDHTKKSSRPSQESKLSVGDGSGPGKMKGDGSVLHLSPFELMHPSMTSPGGPLLQTLTGTISCGCFFFFVFVFLLLLIFSSSSFSIFVFLLLKSKPSFPPPGRPFRCRNLYSDL